MQSWAAIASQLVIIILLSRILTPSDFGYYAVNLSIVHVLMLFAELGTGQFIINQGTVDKELLRSSLGLVTFTSLGVACLAAIVCWLVAVAAPGLSIDVNLFGCLTLVIVCFSVKQVSFAALQSEHQHNKTAITELIGLLANICVAYALALSLNSYWALALGYLSYHVITTALCVALYPVRPSYRDMYRDNAVEFSRSYVFLRMLDMATRTLDNIILAVTTSTYGIGLYQRATNMRNLGHTFSFLPNQQIFYPYLSMSANDAEVLKNIFHKLVKSSLYYAIPVAVFGVCVTPAWFPIVFGPQWNEAIPLVQILAFSIPFRSIDIGLDLLARAKGVQKTIVSNRLMFAGIYILAILIGSLESLEMIAYMATSAFIASSMYSIKLTSRMLDIGFLDVFRFSKNYLVSYFLLIIVSLSFDSFLVQLMIPALSSVVAAGAAVCIFFAWFERGAIRLRWG